MPQYSCRSQHGREFMFPLSPSSGVGTEWKQLFYFCMRDQTCKLKVPSLFTRISGLLSEEWELLEAACLLKLFPSILKEIHTQACAQNPWAMNYKECKQSIDKKTHSIPSDSDGHDSEGDLMFFLVQAE